MESSSSPQSRSRSRSRSRSHHSRSLSPSSSVSLSISTTSPTPSSASLSLVDNDEEEISSSPPSPASCAGAGKCVDDSRSSHLNHRSQQMHTQHRQQQQPRPPLLEAQAQPIDNQDGERMIVLAQLLYERDWDGVFDVLFDEDGEPLLDIRDTNSIDGNDNEEEEGATLNICTILDRLPLLTEEGEDDNAVADAMVTFEILQLEENERRRMLLQRQQEQEAEPLTNGHGNSSHPGSLSATKRSGENLLHAICQFQPPLDLVVLVTQEWPFLVRQCDPITQQYPLHRAALYGSTSKVVRHLLDEYDGAALHPDRDGRLPLHLACRPVQWQPPLQLPLQEQQLSSSSGPNESVTSSPLSAQRSPSSALAFNNGNDEKVHAEEVEEVDDIEDEQQEGDDEKIVTEFEPIYIHAGSAVIRALCDHDARAANVEDRQGCNPLEIAIDHGLSKKICQLLLETSERAWKEEVQNEKERRQELVLERINEWQQEQMELHQRQLLSLSKQSRCQLTIQRQPLQPQQHHQVQPLSTRDVRAIDAGDVDSYLRSSSCTVGSDINTFYAEKMDNAAVAESNHNKLLVALSNAAGSNEHNVPQAIVAVGGGVEHLQHRWTMIDAILPLMRRIWFNSLPPYSEMLSHYRPMMEFLQMSKQQRGTSLALSKSSPTLMMKHSSHGTAKLDKKDGSTLQKQKASTTTTTASKILLAKDGSVEPRRKSMAAGIA